VNAFVEDRFTVIAIIAGYTVNWSLEDGLLGDSVHLEAVCTRVSTAR